jgi:signal transduction histidine kinase
MACRTERRRLAAVLDERRRLARELHDTVEQGLQVTALRLSALGETLRPDEEPNHVRSSLSEIRDLTLHTLTEARRAVWDLGPDTQHQATLAATLEADARRLVGAGSLGLDWAAEGPAWPVSADLATELRRIQSEAITNALKHARASELTIRLQWQPAALRLEIRDDGRGFAEAETSASGTLRLGLEGMRTRADRMGAQWSLVTQPGEGTCIRVTLPNHGARPARRQPTPPAPLDPASPSRTVL